MFFDNWQRVLQLLLTAVCAYIILIIFLRVSGKRTLSKWNAFDFVVTIALGSVLASIIMSKSTPLVEGVFALAFFIGAQFLISWLAVRFGWVKNLIKSEPTILLDKGEFLPAAMKRQRVAEEEIRMAIRASGSAAVEEIEAVVLETDGSLSVVKSAPNGSRTALSDIE